MNVRKPHHKGPMIPGRNRAYKSPNGINTAYLWNKQRLGDVQAVQVNIPRSNQEVGDLIIVAPEPDPLTVVGSLSLAEPSGFQCRYASIDVGRDLLLVMAGGYLKVVDVSDPTNPTLVSTLSGFSSLINQSAIDTVRQLLYASDTNGSTFHVIDYSDPQAPASIGQIAAEQYKSLEYDQARQLVYATEFAGLSPNRDELVVIDVSTPTAPFEAGRFGPFQHLYNSESLAYDPSTQVVYGEGGHGSGAVPHSLSSYDVSNPSAVTQLDTVAGAGSVQHIQLDQARELVFAADTAGDKLLVFDVSNPAALALVGQVQDAAMDNARTVQMHPTEDEVFVAALVADGVAHIDVSNPALPAVIGSVSDSNSMDGLWGSAISNTHLFVIEFTGGELTVLTI